MEDIYLRIIAFRALQAQDPTQLRFLEYSLVITLTPVTITPTTIMIYPFTVHSGLLYMNEVEGQEWIYSEGEILPLG